MSEDMARVTGEDAAELRGRIGGRVHLPGDDDWDQGRAAYNLTADLKPSAIVAASSAADVAATVGFARERGLRVAPMSTGHGAPCFGDLDGVVLLRTGGLDGIEIDPDRKVARAGAGAIWGDVVPLAAEHGLVALHGSSGTVGVAGYTVTGGLGWLARSRGLACNAVKSFEVVTAEGEVMEVGADREPELFWALRGGGGSHAIVTKIEFSLFEMSHFYGGSIMWELEHLHAVAQAWREWTAGAPEQLLATVKAVRFPPFPEIPEPFRGRELAAVTFAFDGPEGEGAALAGELRAGLPEPYLDTVERLPAPALAMIAGDPPEPVPGVGGGVLVETVDEEMIRTWSDAALDAGGMISIELRQLGGQLAREAPGAGALARVPASVSAFAVGAAPTAEAAAGVREELAGLIDAWEPWTASQTLLGFAEQQAGLSESFPSEVASRLRAVKDKYDPDGLILGNHIDERD